MRTITIISLVTLLSFVAACNDDGNAKSTGTVPVGVGAGEVQQVSSGDFLHLEGRLPADFPPTFPIYQNAEIARGDTVSDRFAIDLRTLDEMETAVDFYRTQLASAGWQLVAEEENDKSVLFGFTSEDGIYYGELGIGRLQDKTWILIGMSRPR